VVLQGEESYQDVGEMFHGIPRHVLPHEQNQRSKGKNFELLAKLHGNHSQGMGEVAGLHPSMPAPWD
jgi:hypothetical protein